MGDAGLFMLKIDPAERPDIRDKVGQLISFIRHQYLRFGEHVPGYADQLTVFVDQHFFRCVDHPLIIIGQHIFMRGKQIPGCINDPCIDR